MSSYAVFGTELSTMKEATDDDVNNPAPEVEFSYTCSTFNKEASKQPSENIGEVELPRSVTASHIDKNVNTVL